MADRPSDLRKFFPFPFESVIDQERMNRHVQLIDLWRHCDAAELAADMVILAQMVAFRITQQELLQQTTRDAVVLAAARDGVRRGATHDCGEWRKDGHCELCDKDLTT